MNLLFVSLLTHTQLKNFVYVIAIFKDIVSDYINWFSNRTTNMELKLFRTTSLYDCLRRNHFNFIWWGNDFYFNRQSELIENLEKASKSYEILYINCLWRLFYSTVNFHKILFQTLCCLRINYWYDRLSGKLVCRAHWMYEYA